MVSVALSIATMSLFNLKSEAAVSSPVKLPSPLTSRSKDGVESLMPYLPDSLNVTEPPLVESTVDPPFLFLMETEFGALPSIISDPLK